MLFIVFVGLAFLQGKKALEMIKAGSGGMSGFEYYVRLILRAIFFFVLFSLVVFCLLGLIYGPGYFIKWWIMGKIMPSWMTGGSGIMKEGPLGIMKKMPFRP